MERSRIAGECSKSYMVAFDEVRYRFLIHHIHHSYIAVNITALSPNVAGLKVNASSLPFVQYRSWNSAKERFLELGATPESLDAVDQSLKRTSLAVLAIF